jgi:hypothetical protein
MPMAFDPSMLSHFTGNEHYYRLNRRCLITDGIKYLADEGGTYWLLDAAASYLLELGISDWFVLVRLVVNHSKAVLTLEDGNGAVHASQQIPFTDFSLAEQVMYACWDRNQWVLMLPSEY